MKKFVAICRHTLSPVYNPPLSPEPTELVDWYYFLTDITSSPNSEVIWWGKEIRIARWPVSFVTAEIEFETDNIEELIAKYMDEFL